MPSSLARAHALLKTRKLRRGMLFLVGKALQRISARRIPPLRQAIYHRERLLILEKILEGQSPRAIPHAASVTDVREATQEEIFALPQNQRRYRAWLSDGYSCIIAFKNEEIIGWVWWTDHLKAEARRSLSVILGIDLEDGDVYGFDLHLQPAFRGHGRAIRFLRECERILTERGYRRLRGYVSATDTGARWMYEICGYRSVDSITVRCWLSVLAVANRHLLVRGRQGRSVAILPYRPVR
jgi:GNAT superfamily N-acetyltransferase